MSEHSNEQPTEQHTQPGVAQPDSERDDLLEEQKRTGGADERTEEDADSADGR